MIGWRVSGEPVAVTGDAPPLNAPVFAVMVMVAPTPTQVAGVPANDPVVAVTVTVAPTPTHVCGDGPPPPPVRASSSDMGYSQPKSKVTAYEICWEAVAVPDVNFRYVATTSPGFT